MVLLWGVTALITRLWWEVVSLWVSSLSTAFCCSESLSALSHVTAYAQVCFCSSCHILISSFLQHAHISSKSAEPDWLRTRMLCCNWRSFSCSVLLCLHPTAQLEASLGTFYAPTRPLLDTTVLEYRDPISKYARRFFHHLLRWTVPLAAWAQTAYLKTYLSQASSIMWHFLTAFLFKRKVDFICLYLICYYFPF